MQISILLTQVAALYDWWIHIHGTQADSYRVWEKTNYNLVSTSSVP